MCTASHKLSFLGDSFEAYHLGAGITKLEGKTIEKAPHHDSPPFRIVRLFKVQEPFIAGKEGRSRIERNLSQNGLFSGFGVDSQETM